MPDGSISLILKKNPLNKSIKLYKMKYLGKCILLVLFVSWGSIYAQEAKDKINILASTPPMGWNTWNWFGKDNIDENLIKEVIDAMVSEGLKDAGYTYVVVDGGWRADELGPNGELKVNKEKFPHGMKALADYAHSKGLKFGLHTVPGSHDCGCDKVGGWGNEEIQVNQFVAWGLDFIKLDRCRFSLDEHPDYPRKDPRWFAGWGKDGENIEKAYAKWHKLLQEADRDILLSASVYKYYDWYPKLANMGRTTGDIRSKQSGGAIFEDENNKHTVMAIANKNNQVYTHAQPGYWNDPDMLVVGEQGLTKAEQEIHFALWSIMSAPLILGNDPRNMKDYEKNIITNKTAIMVDQDPTEQGRRVKKDGTCEVWLKRLKGNELAVLLFNTDTEQTKTARVNWKELNISGKSQLYDIFNKRNLGVSNDLFETKLAPRSGRFLLIRSLD